LCGGYFSAGCYTYCQEQELLKYMVESDCDNDGMLDFQEFKVAIKIAQKKLKSREDSGEPSY
jgi:hypothetical protein